MKLVKRKTTNKLQGAVIILWTVAIACVSTTAYCTDWKKEKYWEEFAREELKNAPAAIKKATAVEKARYITFKFCKKCDELGIKHNDSTKDRGRSGLTHFSLVPGTCGWICESLEEAFAATNLGTHLQIITHVPSRTYLQGLKATFYDGVNYNHAAVALEIEGKIFVFDPWVSSWEKDLDNLGDIHPKSKWIGMPASEWGERMNDVGYDMFILQNDENKQWRGEGPQGLTDAIELYHDDQWQERMRLKRVRKRIRERQIERSRGQGEKPPTGEIKPRVISPDNNRTDQKTQESLPDRPPEPETRSEKPPKETANDTGSGLSPRPADLDNWDPNKIKEYYGADDVYKGSGGTIYILKNGQWEQVVVQKSPGGMFPGEDGRKEFDYKSQPEAAKASGPTLPFGVGAGFGAGVSRTERQGGGSAEIRQRDEVVEGTELAGEDPENVGQKSLPGAGVVEEIGSGTDDTAYCPENPDELKTKCAQVNAYIRAFEAQGRKAKWTASVQRAYLFRAHCCGYRWTTEGPEADAKDTAATDETDIEFGETRKPGVGLMGVAVDEKDQDMPHSPSDADDQSWFDAYQDELQEHRASKYRARDIEKTMQDMRRRQQQVANDPEWQNLMQQSLENLRGAGQGLSDSLGAGSSGPSSSDRSYGRTRQETLRYMEKDPYKNRGYRKYQRDAAKKEKEPSSKGTESTTIPDRLLEVDPGDTTVPGEENINNYWPSQ